MCGTASHFHSLFLFVIWFSFLCVCSSAVEMSNAFLNTLNAKRNFSLANVRNIFAEIQKDGGGEGQPRGGVVLNFVRFSHRLIEYSRREYFRTNERMTHSRLMADCMVTFQNSSSPFVFKGRRKKMLHRSSKWGLFYLLFLALRYDEMASNVSQTKTAITFAGNIFNFEWDLTHNFPLVEMNKLKINSHIIMSHFPLKPVICVLKICHS